MTTVTENDIKELKSLIIEINSKLNELDKKYEAKFFELGNQVNELKLEIKVNNVRVEALDKRISDLDKRISDGLNSFDRRVAGQELFYRSVVIGVLGILASAAVKFIFFNPIR